MKKLMMKVVGRSMKVVSIIIVAIVMYDLITLSWWDQIWFSSTWYFVSIGIALAISITSDIIKVKYDKLIDTNEMVNVSEAMISELKSAS